MTGPGGEKDIIDAAMEADDYDYGDKTPDTSTEGSFPEDTATSQGVDTKATPDQTVPAQKEQTIPQGQQQSTQVRSDPSNPLNLKRVGAQFADGKGNIVDKDGKIVARAGESARLWQEASRANAQVSNLQRQNAQLSREMESQRGLLEQAKQIANIPQSLGLTREEYNEGMTLLSQYKTNPVGAARDVVARVLALGYNVTDILGKNAGDALEMKAVAELVKQTTAPLLKDREAAQQQTANEAKANEAYTKFVSTYENAETHGNAIANLMAKGATAVDAYYQIKMFAIEHGLDFTQPLGPQVIANQARQQGQRSTGQHRPMTPGNGRGNESQMTTQPDMADATDDWGSILRGVMSQEQ